MTPARRPASAVRAAGRSSRPLVGAGLLLVVSGAWTDAYPQRPEIAIGRTVYAQSCANQNCHGDQGAAGRAPALAQPGFKRQYVADVTRQGIPETAMPGWEEQLPVEELEAVVTYVFSLQSVSEESVEDLDPNRPWLDHPGRELFFDATRVGACGSCHLFDGWGVPVAPPISGSLPGGVGELLAFRATGVQTARPRSEEPFPALPVESKDGPIQVYDLSSKLPVLRTFSRDRVEVTPGGAWSHGDAIGIYNREELGRILDFMSQAVSGRETEER